MRQTKQQERIELNSLKDIEAALKLGPVYCTVLGLTLINTPLPVRNVRRAPHTKVLQVLTLEGWQVADTIWRHN